MIAAIIPGCRVHLVIRTFGRLAQVRKADGDEAVAVLHLKSVVVFQRFFEFPPDSTTTHPTLSKTDTSSTDSSLDTLFGLSFPNPVSTKQNGNNIQPKWTYYHNIVDMLPTHAISSKRLYTFHTYINVLSENSRKHNQSTHVTDRVLHTAQNSSPVYL